MVEHNQDILNAIEVLKYTKQKFFQEPENNIPMIVDPQTSVQDYPLNGKITVNTQVQKEEEESKFDTRRRSSVNASKATWCDNTINTVNMSQ